MESLQMKAYKKLSKKNKAKVPESIEYMMKTKAAEKVQAVRRNYARTNNDEKNPLKPRRGRKVHVHLLGNIDNLYKFEYPKLYQTECCKSCNQII